ncbi:MAG: hypothetical protein CMN32_04295 [Saprospirales bacterium]|nr:hypothetical protein [Saprospirales bacterium]
MFLFPSVKRKDAAAYARHLAFLSMPGFPHLILLLYFSPPLKIQFLPQSSKTGCSCVQLTLDWQRGNFP